MYIYVHICIYIPYIRRPPRGHQAVRDYLKIQLSSYVGCHVYMSLMSLAVLESCLTAYSHQSAVESLTVRPQKQVKTIHRAHVLVSWGAWKSWFLMNSHGVSWNITTYPEISRILMKCHEISWILVNSHEIQSNIIERSWHLMIFHEISRNIMSSHGISWIIMIFHEISRYFMKYYDFSWFLMNNHDISWSIMKYHDLSWLIMNYDESWWIVMTSAYFLSQNELPTST